MTDQEKTKDPEIESEGSISPDGDTNAEDNIEVVEDDQLEQNEQEILDPEQQIEQLNAELAVEREKYLRALADMDNLRKRCRRDIEDSRISGRSNILEELLPALDSIDMALKSVEPTDANQAVYDGMIMVRKQFLSSMERFELVPISTQGSKFDPSHHEAVSYVPSVDHETGDIIEEMRSGYTLGKRLLRASMVVVSSGKPAEPSDNSDTEDEVQATNNADETTPSAEETN